MPNFYPISAYALDLLTDITAVPTRLRNSVSFYAQAILNPTRIGAISPSSRSLADRMVQQIAGDSERSRRILEIGAGTGVITKRVLEELTEGDHLDVIECVPELAEKVQRVVNESGKQDQVQVHTCYVQDFEETAPYDHVISALPLNNFAPDLVRRIQNKVWSLMADHSTLTYFEYIALPTIKWLGLGLYSVINSSPLENFDQVLAAKKEFLEDLNVTTETVYRNLPPARVVYARNH